MNKLMLIEDGLIKVYQTDKKEKVVNARDLHNGLGVQRDFSTWVKSNLNNVDAVENIDYTSLPFKEERGIGATTKIEYILKLDTAKEICMIAGASPRANKELKKRSKTYRKYLIDIEKKYNKLKQDIIDQNELIVKAVTAKTVEERIIALGDYNQKVNAELRQKDKQIEEMKPKVLFANAVETSKSSILVGELSKIIKQNGVYIGQNKLFKWLRDNNYLCKKGEKYNLPTDKAMTMGLFEIKKTTINNPDGSIRTTRTTKVTGKGQQYFINKFLKTA
ncbi:MAG: phage antirepressor KilAC domain-containing protein [Vallitalea sp.]|jgi:anti-repressor protein|nr:phage antirepressor KilAC domain-containing protein [Vallitalea sp.]